MAKLLSPLDTSRRGKVSGEKMEKSKSSLVFPRHFFVGWARKKEERAEGEGSRDAAASGEGGG